MNKESINTEIANMNVGDSILVSFKGTSTSKIQITLGEKIVTKSGNPLALLNASDAKFNVTSKARRAWLTSEPSDAKIYFPQYASQIDEAAAGDKSTEVFIGELNPSIAGQVLRVELKETTTPTAYQANNLISHCIGDEIKKQTDSKSSSGGEILPPGFINLIGSTMLQNNTQLEIHT